jgi:hypothetical protein
VGGIRRLGAGWFALSRSPKCSGEMRRFLEEHIALPCCPLTNQDENTSEPMTIFLNWLDQLSNVCRRNRMSPTDEAGRSRF